MREASDVIGTQTAICMHTQINYLENLSHIDIRIIFCSPSLWLMSGCIVQCQYSSDGQSGFSNSTASRVRFFVRCASSHETVSEWDCRRRSLRRPAAPSLRSWTTNSSLPLPLTSLSSSVCLLNVARRRRCRCDSVPNLLVTPTAATADAPLGNTASRH